MKREMPDKRRVRRRWKWHEHFWQLSASASAEWLREPPSKPTTEIFLILASIPKFTFCCCISYKFLLIFRVCITIILIVTTSPKLWFLSRGKLSAFPKLVAFWLGKPRIRRALQLCRRRRRAVNVTRQHWQIPISDVLNFDWLVTLADTKVSSKRGAKLKHNK